MHEPTYRQAIANAWHLVWHNKILWIFGMLSAVLGELSLNDFLGRMWWLSDKSATNDWWQKIQITVQPIGGWTETVGWVWVGAIILCLTVFFTFIAVSSQGALIAASGEMFEKKKVDFSEAWKQGVKHFWKVLALNVFRGLALFFLTILFWFFCLNFFAMGGFSGFLCLAIFSCVVFILALAVSIMFIYSAGYAVLENKNIISSIRGGWLMFSKHLLVSCEVSLFFLFLNFVLIAILFLGGFIVFLPSLVVWTVAGLTGYAEIMVLGLILGFLLLAVFIVIAGGLLNAFTTTVWMYLFVKMRKEGVVSRIIHYIKKIIKK
ncbi:MAG: hypothetical protein PHY40_00585 [Patescibacteria group bacterium]|nr:hypothetical protein [Patescibacteria group bacterium]